MLGTALLMSKMANESQDDLNQIETIGFKWGTSVYSGWLSAATILNTSIVLKHSGIADGWNEELWAVIILWVAVAIYGVNSFLNNDPVYAGVFVWACFGIRSQNENDMIEANVTIIMAMMAAYVIALPFITPMLE